MPLAEKWNAEYRFSEGRGASRWKQILKNHFVHLTQFGSHDPGQEKKQWRRDLEIAAKFTVDEICPDWRTNSADLATYKAIMKEAARKNSPRQHWLREKAYAWLKSLPRWSPGHTIQVEQESLHPGHAIAVAHEIFLRSAGKFQKFVKHLRGRGKGNEAIGKLIDAHCKLARHNNIDNLPGDGIAHQVFDI